MITFVYTSLCIILSQIFRQFYILFIISNNCCIPFLKMPFLNLFYFYILLLHYQMVYSEFRYISIYRPKTADRLGVLKPNFNNLSRSRFGRNRSYIFGGNDEHPLNPFFYNKLFRLIFYLKMLIIETKT